MVSSRSTKSILLASLVLNPLVLGEPVISIQLVPKHSAVRKSSTVKGIKSIFVQSQSAVVENDKVKEYRVNLKLTFEVKD